jgi:hypothetical protein
MIDVMANIQARYRSAIYSYETALHLLGLTDQGSNLEAESSNLSGGIIFGNKGMPL